MQVVLVPVKSLERVKTRLAGVLSPAERRELTLALMEDVLDACIGQPGWEPAVISPDREVLEVARGRGAHPVREKGHTLLEAVRQCEAWVATGGPDGALAVVLGDLPYLSSAELSAALSRPEPVVAAPAASDGGTNVLMRRPPGIIRARFGRASLAKHRWAARRARVAFGEARGLGLEMDLDTPSDLARLVASPVGGRAHQACLRMGLEQRLRTRAGA